MRPKRVLLTLLVLAFPAIPALAWADPYASLAIGVPYEDTEGGDQAGAVNVLPGSIGGLTSAASQFWRQGADGLGDATEAVDWFGYVLAAGDFNGDGYPDLAIGVPSEDIGTAAGAGAVHVLYGTCLGLSAAGSRLWHQGVAGVNGAVEEGDNFGGSLAVGDFDGDGFDDLAVGVPYEHVGDIADAGCVNVLYGSSNGLVAERNQLWYQGNSGLWEDAEANDRFGYALAAGDFDHDGRDDLVIGVPQEDILENTEADAGIVQVLYGSGSGLGTLGQQSWSQYSLWGPSAEVADDRFGFALTVGDFDGDGADDLAVGVPYEDVPPFGGGDPLAEAGAVNVIYGSADGLALGGKQSWHQDVPDVAEWAEVGDGFGRVLAAGDFDGDGYADLAVGTPYEDLEASGAGWAGAVNVFYGTSIGLSAERNQVWSQDLVEYDGPENGDRFGSALAAGDFDGDGMDDLAIGVPFEDLEDLSLTEAGIVQVLFGSSPSGLTTAHWENWRQVVPSVQDGAESGDRFGHALAAIPAATAEPWWSGLPDLGGGWRWLEWLGFFNITSVPWIYHEQFGWMYVSGCSADDLWVYVNRMGAVGDWLYTTRALFPYLYRSSDGNWLYYLEWTASPSWFANLGTGVWEAWYLLP